MLSEYSLEDSRASRETYQQLPLFRSNVTLKSFLGKILEILKRRGVGQPVINLVPCLFSTPLLGYVRVTRFDLRTLNQKSSSSQTLHHSMFIPVSHIRENYH